MLTEKINSDNGRLVAAGFLLTFFSSFGQTFLLSLYVPGILRDFGISNSVFGSIYGAATVLSAFTLIYAGNFIDSWHVRKYTAAAVMLFAVFSLVTGFSPNIAVLFAGIYGLRFAGQGLFTHIATTVISRFFTASRGKALSISSLGYSLGEGILPAVTGFVIVFAGWRNSFLINSLLLAFVLFPLVMYTLGSSEYRAKDSASGVKWGKFSRKELFSDSRFYILAANSFVQPFVVTGLFFYQIELASSRGWPLELLTASFALYAAGRALFSLAGGPMVDRFTAVRMLPLYLLPYGFALTALLFSTGNFIAPVYLVLTGVSIGLSSTVKTAALAEVYGTRNIGSIRSVFSMISVLSTAASPSLFGFIIDRGYDFNVILKLSLALVLASTLVSFLFYRESFNGKTGKTE